MILFPHLSAPIRVGPRAAKNRIMRVATTANLADRNRVGERVLAGRPADRSAQHGAHALAEAHAAARAVGSVAIRAPVV
jgi:hypothetical protein